MPGCTTPASVDEIERAVDQTPGIDPWCSGPDWFIPARDAFAPNSEPLVVATANSFAHLAHYPTDGTATMVAGYEPLWGFACPLVGPNPVALAEAVADQLAADLRWGQLLLPGFPIDLTLARQVAQPLAQLGEVSAGVGITRQVADLDDFDAWFQRRSPKTRRNLRRAERQAQSAGLTFEVCDQQPGLVSRLEAVEALSWKGQEGDGLLSPEMGNFYASMIASLQAQHRCRAVVARHEGKDIGFVLGGVRRQCYRGLVLSYSQACSELSVSHLLQLHEVRRLCREKASYRYDIGMDMPYKRSWADRAEDTAVLIVRRTT